MFRTNSLSRNYTKSYKILRHFEMTTVQDFCGESITFETVISQTNGKLCPLHTNTKFDYICKNCPQSISFG